MMTVDGLLLDTCAVIWLSQDARVAPAAKAAIERARKAKATVGVSQMTAWEIGMLVSKDRLPAVKDAERWFEEFVERAAVVVWPLTTRVLVDSSFLPHFDHGDPMDRIVVATARSNNLAIVTRDRLILAYGTAGHVRTVRC
ncbi:type II toxin-antitoxin system VapC family toxin [Aquibium microcysteis]|uniref:type II toxin-antitoxin system VapC family toxin n=1 Tax=Aquibium microcysteis TaxID=675281 RepID=UPI001EF1CDDD|nr:type II toxin-antitoxin system VapC family toxin [Aquibium microcysteis]